MTGSAVATQEPRGTQLKPFQANAPSANTESPV
jgi:hypothetical protein